MTPGETVTFVGFDSAWTDNLRAPGAICALTISDGRPTAFHAPQLACFDDALAFVEMLGTVGPMLIALDQSTVVPNPSGSRPVERLAASVVSWIGGGVQPSSRSRTGMFCDNSPIWPFLKKLDGIEDPEASRTASSGRFLMEVFPALALPSIDPAFCGRMLAPKYNPANRRKFRMADWHAVTRSVAARFSVLGLKEAAEWCARAGALEKPAKRDQDMLDAMICLFVAAHWRLAPRADSIVIGDRRSGYIVTPASPAIHARLKARGEILGVPTDSCSGASEFPAFS